MSKRFGHLPRVIHAGLHAETDCQTEKKSHIEQAIITTATVRR